MVLAITKAQEKTLEGREGSMDIAGPQKIV